VFRVFCCGNIAANLRNLPWDTINTPFLFRLLHFNLFILFSIHHVSFDACIVTITWACLCVVISLWATCQAFVVLFSLGVVDDKVIEVRVSSNKL
jgi:hypothetical protein